MRDPADRLVAVGVHSRVEKWPQTPGMTESLGVGHLLGFPGHVLGWEVQVFLPRRDTAWALMSPSARTRSLP